MSKNRSMLNELTVNSSAAGTGTAVNVTFPLTKGGEVPSGRIVYVRNA